MRAESSSMHHMALAAMTNHILADLGAAPFDALGDARPRALTAVPATLPATLQDSWYYFDGEGFSLPAANDEAVYECRVTKKADPDTRGHAGGPYNLVLLEMHFSWPLSAAATADNRPGRQRVQAHLSRP